VIPHERITTLHGVSVMRVGLILFQRDLAQQAMMQLSIPAKRMKVLQDFNTLLWPY
jgi:hypothetical protein